MDPIPTDKELMKIYCYEQSKEKSTKFISKLNPALGKVIDNQFLMRLLGYWSRWVTRSRAEKSAEFIKNGLVIDIGCGPGEYLKAMKSLGFEIYGCEMGDNLVETARKNSGSKNIFKGELTKLKFPPVDLITFWHVLEHITNFNSTLKKVSEQLNSNGGVVIEVPHAQSLNFSLFKSYWTLMLLPQHLYFWSEKSFQILLSNHKLQAVKFEYPSHFPFVFFSSLVKLMPAFIYLAPILIPVSWLVSQIANLLGRGDVIRVYARKS